MQAQAGFEKGFWGFALVYSVCARFSGMQGSGCGVEVRWFWCELSCYVLACAAVFSLATQGMRGCKRPIVCWKVMHNPPCGSRSWTCLHEGVLVHGGCCLCCWFCMCCQHSKLSQQQLQLDMACGCISTFVCCCLLHRIATVAVCHTLFSDAWCESPGTVLENNTCAQGPSRQSTGAAPPLNDIVCISHPAVLDSLLGSRQGVPQGLSELLQQDTVLRQSKKAILSMCWVTM
jgi:hypothetical protein